MLIGITGTHGAGKGTVAQYLAKKHSFIYLSVRAFFAAEVVRDGKAASRTNIIEIAANLRAKYGPNYPLEQLLNSTPHVKNIVIESIRTVGEVNFLKTHGDALWAVDADSKIRYKRTVMMAADVSNLSFEQFEAEDKTEYQSGDPNTPNLLVTMSMADYTIRNEGTKEELFAAIEKALEKTH